jgi:hypothetical protein
VGARALVALARADGDYELYHAQRGASQSRFRAVLDGGALRSVLAESTRVFAAGSATDVLAALDPREYEVLYVRDGEVTAYLVCWLGIETTTGSSDPAVRSLAADAAALVPVADPAVAAGLRRFLRESKAVPGEAVDAGLLSLPVAVRYLGSWLARHPDVPRETLWLPPGAW